MSENLRERLMRGESTMARGLPDEPPLDAVVARVRRRRVVRATAVAAASASVLLGGAWVGSAYLGDAQDPAMVPSATSSPSLTPTPAIPSDGALLDQALAQIVPASAAAANAAFDPVPGPLVQIGVVTAVEDMGPEAAKNCGVGPCERLQLPPITPSVL